MPVKSYLRLIASQPRLLGFGFAMTFASSIGQTFFIGAFGPSIQQDFALGHAEWGGFYMAGTLLSAALLPWTGAWIARLPLGRYTALVVAGMVVAAASMGLVPSAAFLVLAVFLLRQTGQVLGDGRFYLILPAVLAPSFVVTALFFHHLTLAVAVSVFASALGPVVMGGLLDGGVSVETICLSFALYCLLASVSLVAGLKGLARRP